MDMQKLTQKSQEALQQAQSRAVTFGHQQVGPEHLLLGLLDQRDGLLARLLERMDIAPDRVAEGLWLGLLLAALYAADALAQMAPSRLERTRERWRPQTPFMPVDRRE